MRGRDVWLMVERRKASSCHRDPSLATVCQIPRTTHGIEQELNKYTRNERPQYEDCRHMTQGRTAYVPNENKS